MTRRPIRLISILLSTVVAAQLWANAANADSIRGQQWFLGFLDAGKAQQTTRGQGVVVAVIDSGSDGSHPDLRGNVLPGYSVTPGQSGNGWADTNGHGTAMAGLIAAHGRGDAGALGIAPGSRILPIQGIGSALDSPDLVAQAIGLAIRHNARVISISVDSGPSPSLQAAVQAAYDADIVVVAGAGNTPAISVAYPAHYQNVLAISAVDRDGKHADISVAGQQIALAAPGVDICSTFKGGRYATGTGTSDATAIVAGAVALVRSKYPDLSAAEVIHRLTATAIDKGPPGRDDQYGYGIINIVAALTANVPPLASASSAPPSNTQPSAVAESPTRAQASGAGTHAVALLVVVLGGLAALALLIVFIVRQSRHT